MRTKNIKLAETAGVTQADHGAGTAQAIPMVEDRYVKVAGAEEITGHPKGTLDLLRSKGGGPMYIKRGRSVYYSVRALHEWMQARTLSSTADQ